MFFQELNLMLRPHSAGGTLKQRCHSQNASNVFRPHFAGGIEKHAITGHLCLRRTRSVKSPYRDVIIFNFFFLPRESEKAAFSNSCVLKSVFENLRVCDG